MIQFSANLGFLWADLALPDAIRAAHRAGFDAVECHWPYETPADDVRDALQDTGLKMLGINTQRGNRNGLSAVPGREHEARSFIDEAIAYAGVIEAGAIHVMAGFTDRDDTAERVFRQNLSYACEAAPDKTILIEALNTYDAPDYHISTIEEAMRTLGAVDAPNLKLMFDCYHIQIMQGDLLRRFRDHIGSIGHIQFAGVPDRGEPDCGEVNYPWLLHEIHELGWIAPMGAEYKPRSDTDAGLHWLHAFRGDRGADRP